MSNTFLHLVQSKRVLLADGATGTNLFAMGLQSGDAPEMWNVDHPDRVASLHQSFVDAGSDLFLTNTFGGTRHRLKLHRAEDRVAELNEAAASIAREVADAAPREVAVAGSMGPTGELFQPLGALHMEEAIVAFEEQARGLANGGVDVLWVETMSSREEVEAALRGAYVTGLPLVCTLSFDTNGRTMMGITPADFVATCRELEPSPAAYGTNCGLGPSEVVAGILGLRRATHEDDLLVAKANCGIPDFVDGAIRYQGTAELMADYARLSIDAGARIIGGCCGTTPEIIAAMRTAIDNHERSDAPDLETVEQRLGALTRGTKSVDDASVVPSPSPRSGRRRRQRKAG
jgi:5-methyltetrahydrofolate--homocysteine methyltransferase